MKRIFTIIAFTQIYCTCIAQNEPISITTEESNGQITFWAENKFSTNYSVHLIIDLNGYTSGSGTDFIKTISPGKTRINILKPTNSSGAYYRYSYSYLKGGFSKKIDSDFIYLLPVSPPNKIRSTSVTYLGELFGKKNNNFYSQGFLFHNKDTLRAARSGVICEIIKNEEVQKESMVYKANRNLIEIMHKDGSIGRYIIPDYLVPLVKLGDSIMAGDPLAILGAEGKEPQVLFSVDYIDLNAWRQADKTKSVYVNICPEFYLEDGKAASLEQGLEYKSIHPEEIITQELSKREKKKRAEELTSKKAH